MSGSEEELRAALDSLLLEWREAGLTFEGDVGLYRHPLTGHRSLWHIVPGHKPVKLPGFEDLGDARQAKAMLRVAFHSARWVRTQGGAR